MGIRICGGKDEEMERKRLAMFVSMGLMFWFVSPIWSAPMKPVLFYSKVETGMGREKRSREISEIANNVPNPTWPSPVTV